ncbi:hydroxyethylthiazole kinase [Rubrimonas cliftonensis]|uniref:Hydroxyethylthiazole kinase n=1 Tax=Rubrimonas cliftonensis TaxID=89524 RepID=A0A1H4C154_9RHOB|nr:hydroxyethylthiazole kinase [Rubrimonas cliftonensis]SEA54106.1 hydroxyethylthiazole kinase [Rubrimonas cliftonensis]
MIDCADHLGAMRAAAPLVHCVTNFVAMEPTANALLAAGAAPAMAHAVEEAGDFATVAAAVSINIGTPSPRWAEGMAAAAGAAAARGAPWVLDPVAVYASPWRGELAARLLALKPTAVRGNASEVLALAGGASAGRGPDAGDAVAAAEDAARRLARATGGVVAVTGPEDFVTDGRRDLRVSGGDKLMTRVTALGCALSAMVGAFLATGRPPLEATAAALAYYGLAGARAAREASGPGSFAPLFLDALAGLDPAADAGALAAAVREGA